MENMKLCKALFKNLEPGKEKRNFRVLFLASCVVVSTIFFTCTDNPIPDELYPSQDVPSLSDRPTITDIIPNAIAGDAVREIQIRGTKLGIKNGTDTNWLFIGGLKPIYKQITDSLITIYRPSLSDDKYGVTIYFNITDPSFDGVSSSKEYVIQRPGAIVGDYTLAGNAAVQAFDFDTKENLYAFIGGSRTLLRTDSAGVSQATILNAAYFPSGTTVLSTTTDMTFGPGDSLKNLYIINGQNIIYRQKWSVDAPATTNKGVKITITPEVAKMDLDEIGNIYAGGRTGIYRISSSIGTVDTPQVSASLGYAGLNIRQVRITKIGSTNYIYVADSLRVWRSVLSNGAFADKEQELVTLIGTAYQDSNYINSIAIGAGGELYLCLKNHPKYSLFVVESDNSITPFYFDPSILPHTVDQLEWGNHNQLYLLSGSLLNNPGRIYRINLDRNGAPYYGRQFVQ